MESANTSISTPCVRGRVVRICLILSAIVLGMVLFELKAHPIRRHLAQFQQLQNDNPRPRPYQATPTLLVNVSKDCFQSFQKILLVITFNYAIYDNIPVLRKLYNLVFPNIVYCGPETSMKYPILQVEHEKGYWGYECLGKAIRTYPDFDGYFYINDDSIVNWWNVANFDLTKVWVSTDDMIKKSFGADMTKDKPPNTWHWWYDVDAFERCKEAFSETEQVLNSTKYQSISPEAFAIFYKNTQNRRLCGVTSSDVFYVPKSLRFLYSNLSSIFFKHKVFLEVSVPTILRFLDLKENFLSLDGIYLRYIYGSIDFTSGEQFWENYSTKKTFFHPLKISTRKMSRRLFLELVVEYAKKVVQLCYSRTDSQETKRA